MIPWFRLSEFFLNAFGMLDHDVCAEAVPRLLGIDVYVYTSIRLCV